MYPYYGNGHTETEEVISSKQVSKSGNIEVVNAADIYDIIEIDNLSCRPCSKIGYSKCPLKHFKCMQLISTETVMERITKVL